MRMWAYLLIISGAALLFTGFYLLRKSKNSFSPKIERQIDLAIADGTLTAREEEKLRQIAPRGKAEAVVSAARARLESRSEPSETRMRNHNKEAGDAFEKFVLERFDQKYFTLDQWAGDKFHDGRFDETTQQPDLLLTLNLGKEKHPLAVECKWRREFKNGWIEWASKKQVARYQTFEKNSGRKTFVAIGVGGKPDQPEQFYVVPLYRLTRTVAQRDYISEFLISPSKDLYYNTEEEVFVERR